jgi:hypothetical protein
MSHSLGTPKASCTLAHTLASVQAADFLADDHAMKYSCLELSRRMFGKIDGEPAIKKLKTQKNGVAMLYQQIGARRDANEKVGFF